MSRRSITNRPEESRGSHARGAVAAIAGIGPAIRRRCLPLAVVAIAGAASCALIAASGSTAADPDERAGSGGKAKIRGSATGRRAELRPTVPIASRSGDETRSVLSLKLPELQRGDVVRFNSEVLITTTCVEQIGRCIGQTYAYDPRLEARVVLAGDRDGTRRHTRPVSGSVGLSCEQTRPNRNHHCPLVIEGGSFTVGELRDLPCKASKCRLNVILDAHHPSAASNQFVVVGSDQPDGSVEGGKARLSAAVSSGRVEIEERSTSRAVHRSLPASFSGGKTVVYSQKLGRLRGGDVLLVRSRQRTSIQSVPYFISNQIVISTRRGAARPSALTRRIVSRSGLATETTGFNCTIGPSAFQSPCPAVKAGMAVIERTPMSKRGRPRPLYVNLVSRGFPKLAQARASFPPARIVDGGRLTVRRLRITGGKR